MPRQLAVIADRHLILNASRRRINDGRYAWRCLAVQNECRGFASQHLRVAPFLGEDAGANQRAGEHATKAKTANEEGDDRNMFITLRTKIYAEARDGYVHIYGESSLNLIAN